MFVSVQPREASQKQKVEGLRDGRLLGDARVPPSRGLISESSELEAEFGEVLGESVGVV